MTFDAAGNMTQDGTGFGTHTYQWDAENRLCSVDNGATETYTYNALGQRVERAGTCQPWTTATCEEVYDAFGNLAMITRTNGGALVIYVAPVAGRQFAEYSNGYTWFSHTNALGSVGTVTNQAGTLLQGEIYYPWGYTWATSGSVYWERFASMPKVRDVETGLDPATNRMMSSRWHSPDPLAGDVMNPQSLNRYAYVLNNPTTMVDPLGLGQCVPGAPGYEDDCPGGGGGGAGNDGPGSVFWDLLFGGGGGGSSFALLLDMGAGRVGGGTPGGTHDISKTWSKTFPCTQNATQLMATVKGDFSQFADNPVGPLIAKFPSTPITQGANLTIYSGLFTFTDAGPVYTNGLNVTVTSQTATSWMFTTDPAHHFFNGTIAFMAGDAGNGNVNFDITANANWASKWYRPLGLIIKAGEDSTWTNLLANVQAHCQSAGGTKP